RPGRAGRRPHGGRPPLPARARALRKSPRRRRARGGPAAGGGDRRGCSALAGRPSRQRRRPAPPDPAIGRVTPSPVFLPVRELARLVRTRQVSPVALAETVLERLTTLGPRYNAVVTVMRERALDAARRAEREIAVGRYRGPLHGIPYGAKDLLATGDGVPTTWGAAPLRAQTFDRDAAVIRR